MTAQKQLEVIKWIAGTFGVSIVSLVIWGATLTSENKQMRTEMDDIWSKYNTTIEQRTAAIERLVKVESCCADCKEKIDDLERTQRWKNKN